MYYSFAMEEKWMLKLLGVPRSKVLEWSITMAETSIRFARVHEPEKVQRYEKHLRELKAHQSIELLNSGLYPTIQNNRQ